MRKSPLSTAVSLWMTCLLYTSCFDRQSPQAYSVSIPRLWAQMCGYGAGETGGNRLCGGSQLLRCGSTEDCKSFVPGCRGAERPVDVRLAPTGAERRPAAHCQGQGAAPIGRLRAAAIIGSRTVSYTHLDVYKTQILYWASASTKNLCLLLQM